MFLYLLSHLIEVLRLSKEIGERTKEQLDDRQRKFLLREQLKTIQKELGENGGEDPELARIDEAIGKAAMPAETEAQARKELHRLRGMPDASSEASMLRTWLEWMVELPWAPPVERPIDLQTARATLEADHFGLERVKQRIAEFLAVRKLNPQGRALILCFVGPPAADKTSLGKASHGRCSVPSCACRWEVCITRPKFAAIAVPTSAPCPATSCRVCARPVRAIA